MPVSEAIPFTTYGAFNGFPLCLDKVDVLGFDLVAVWSLADAMDLWWNIAGVRGRAEGQGYDGIISVTEANVVDNYIGTGSETPIGKICDAGWVGARKIESSDDFVFQATLSVSNNNLVRLYDGDTEDEDNFLGYGVTYTGTGVYRDEPIAQANWFGLFEANDAYYFNVIKDETSIFGQTPTSGPTSVIIGGLSMYEVKLETNPGTSIAEVIGFDYYQYPAPE